MQAIIVQRKIIIRFLLLAVGIYALLMLGRPVFGELYAQGFRAALRATLAGASGVREVEVEADQPSARTTQVVIVNRRRLAPDGSGPVRNVDLPTAAFWQATVLLLALALASPFRLSLRLGAAFGGFLLVQLFVAFSVWFMIWNQGRYIGLGALAPQWAAVADKIETLLVEQAILVVPVLAWAAGLWAGRRWQLACPAARAR
jgi:hypothetical protein